MTSVLMILDLIASAIFILVLTQFIISILAMFDVINIRQPFVSRVYYGIGQLLDPLLNPIRRILPPTGGLDFSPVVLLLGITALQIIIRNNM